MRALMGEPKGSEAALCVGRSERRGIMWPSLGAIGSVSTCPCNYCSHPPLYTIRLLPRRRADYLQTAECRAESEAE